jgi:hypothetical protein
MLHQPHEDFNLNKKYSFILRRIKMSVATRELHITKQYTTLWLIGGYDCNPKYNPFPLAINQPGNGIVKVSSAIPNVDLRVMGGAEIYKNLCVNGNIMTPSTVIAEKISSNIIHGNSITVTGNVTCDNLITGNVILINDCIKQNSTKVVFGNTLNIIPTNSKTIIMWDKTEYGNKWDGETKILINKTGVYHLDATMDWEGNPFGERNIFTLVNGNIAGSADTKSVQYYSGNVVQSCSCDISLTKGDNVQLMVEQTSQSNVIVNIYGLANMSVRYVHSVPSGITPTPLFQLQPNLKLKEEQNTLEIRQLRQEMDDLRKTIASLNTNQIKGKLQRRPKHLSSINRMM